MRKLLKKRVFINFLSAIIFGAIYVLFSFVDKGYIEIGKILIAVVLYFLLMCLFFCILPKLKKTTGHDKDNS
jgi:hypothetical protein